MRCPKCGSTDCQVFVTNNVKIHSSTKGFGGGKACCGLMCLTLLGYCEACAGQGRRRRGVSKSRKNIGFARIVEADLPNSM